MERRSMWSRLLAVVLAVSMIFSSQSMSVFADTLVIMEKPQATSEGNNPQSADDDNNGGDDGNVPGSPEGEEPGSEAETQEESQPESSDEGQTATVQTTGTINGTNVNLRAQASTNAEILSTAQEGQVVSILGEVTGDDGNQWYEILYGEGSAFVSAQYVTVNETATDDESEEETQEVVAEEETESETPKKAARRAAKNAEIQITADKEKAVLTESVTLTYAGKVAEGSTLQWQQEVSDGQWMDITGQTGKEYSFTFTNANAGYSYRLVILNAENEITATSNEIKISKKTVEELAAEYYGGDNPKETMAYVYMTQKDANADGTIKAGETLTYNISYELRRPPLYNYSDGPTRLFSQYGETTVSLQLPQGMKVTAASNEIKYTYDEATDTYTFELGTPSTGTIKSFDITVVLDTNGTQEINKKLEISEEDLQIHTSATILDKDNGNQSAGTYSQDHNADSVPQALTTTTSDDWGITKSVKNVIYTPAEGEPEKVTVVYEIALGLLTKSGSLSNNASDYAAEGRAPFQMIQLTELLSEVTDRKGNTINPVEGSVKLTENFEGGKTYSLTDEQIKGTAPITVNTDTCAGKAQGGGDLSGVASNAAYYTTYTVEVTYPYADFDADWKENPTKESIEVQNQATLSYQFKGGSVVEKEPVYAATSLGEITEPVELTIVKKIGSYKDNSSQAYTEENYPLTDLVSGSVRFKITDADGSGVPVYTKETDGKYSLLNEGGVVNLYSIDGGKVTVYLDPGTYTVKETDAPKNTILDGTPQTADLTTAKTATLTFVNKEDLGGIKITKEDAQNSATKLSGAEFTIEKVTETSEGQYTTDPTFTPQTVTTGDNGTVEVTRLVPGTYRITETKAPENYIIADEAQIVTVTTGNTAEATFTNKKNASGSVTLTKYVVGPDGTERQVTADDGFDGTFTLESTTTPNLENSWKEVTVGGQSEWSLTTNGTLPLSGLAAYEGEAVITYRFKENLPEGWHAVDNPMATVAYSEMFTLEKVVGTDTAQSVSMTNVLNGTLTLTKYFDEVVDKTEGTLLNASGSQVERKASQGEVTFQLYQKIGENGEITAYNNGNNLFQTDSNGQIIIKDLARKSSNNETIYYYLYEEPIGNTDYDYTMVSDSTAEVDINDDGTPETLIGPFDFADTLKESTTVHNVQQMVTVKILKYDTVGKKNITGAKINIKDSKETPVVETATIESTSGYIVALKPGEEYTVSEIVAPPNYILTDETATIDLTGVSVTEETQNPYQTVTINNKPYQSLTITKILQNANGTTDTTSLKGTSFEVYQFTGKDSTNVTSEDLQRVEQVLKAGTALQLAPGTYYLKETYDDSKDVLDVNASEYRKLYKELLEKNKVPYKEVGDDFYFGPYEITEDKGATGNIYNISSLGGVKVQKTDEQGKALANAELAIYTKDEKGELVQQGEAQKSGTDGYVTFKDLEIYGTDGKPITYYIKETETPSDAYYLSDEELEVTLEPNQIIESTQDGKALTLVNKLYRKFTVTKIFVDLWETSFTGNTMLLSGAKIALYKWDDEKDAYIYTGQTKTTNLSGQVVFEDLEGNDYVAVEVSVPDIGISMEPEGGALYLEDPEQNKQLSKTELEQYNYVKMDPDDVDNTGTLVNEKGWTQIVVDKFKWTYDSDALMEEDTEEKYEDQYNLTSDEVAALRKKDPDLLDEIEKKRTPQNTSIFKLYKQVVTEEDGTALTFNANNCEEIGTYTTGTMTDTTGEIVDGQFATDILETGKNIVYWLVETDAGVGASIIPEYQIILFHQQGTNYSNASQSIEEPKSACAIAEEYPKNARAEYEWENQAEYGPGKLHLANVKFSKWAGDYEEDGTTKDYDSYKVLGGAQYELWVADADGNLLKKVEDLTTGLENDVSDTTTDKTGVAVSTTLYMEAGEEENAEEEPYKNLFQFMNPDDEENENNPAWNAGDVDGDNVDDYYVRMAIKETYAPYGYKQDSRIYYMLVLFTSNGVETNEAYYVSEEENRGEYEENLAENQPEKPIVWAESDDHYRLVNWPIDYHQVTVNQYGYDPSTLATPTGNTAEELDALLETGNLTPITNTAKLQRYDDESDTWRDYDFNNNAWVNDGEETPIFTTSRTFENGLISGKYRIIETGMPGGNYDKMYDGSTVNGQVIARYFTVGNRDITVNMYNPKPLDLTLTKTDLRGTIKVEGITFTLYPVNSDTGYRTDTSGPDGEIDFTGIMTGKYWMKESAGTTNYSAEYFQKYLANIGLSDLGNRSQGIFLGYEKSVEDGDAVISKITDFASYQTGGLTIKNPSLVSLTVKKVDAEKPNAAEGLSGAEFELYWIPFDTFSSHAFNSSAVGTKVDKQPTESNGIYTWSGLQPGVYRIHETKAPEGYDFDEDNADTWVIIKGDMTVTITGAEGITTIDGKDNNTENAVVIENTAKATLRIKKIVVAFPDSQEGDEKLEVPSDTTATFNLYETATSEKPLNTEPIEIKANTNQSEEAISGLVQGKDYYLEEADSADFALKEIKVNGAVPATENGRYKITPDASEVTVEVTNTYLWTEVTIQKVNGENGRGLSGAEFTVKKVNGQTETELTENVQFTYSENQNGEYTFKIRLDGDAAATYRIYETAAPEGYEISKIQEPIEVTLNPGEKKVHGSWEKEDANNDEAMLEKLIMPNYNTATITLTKYGNLKDSATQTELNDATFVLYQKVNGTWMEYDREKTVDDGTLTFTVVGGREYALKETDNSKYVGLEGIWNTTEDEEPVKEVNGYYELGTITANAECSLKAYNIPKLELEIRKSDANNPAIVPTAQVSVYEVDPEASKGKSFANVGELKSFLETAAIGNPVTVTTATTNGTAYSSATVEVQPGKTYLVKEDKVTGPEGYGSMITNDKDVVWYQFVTIAPEVTSSEELDPVELKNVKGSVDLGLTKELKAVNNETAPEKLPSLFEGTQNLTYVLNPTVDNNTYGLNSFTLTDEGLTAYHLNYNEETKTSTYESLTMEEGWYSIESVRVGQSSHDATAYEEGSYPIKATITFIDFDGGTHSVGPVDVSLGNQLITKPADAGDIQSIKIEYTSALESTPSAYMLGKDFTPGDVEVNVVVKGRQGGETAQSVDQIQNDSTAVVTWDRWDSEGNRQEPQEEQSLGVKSAEADNSRDIAEEEAALVSISKKAGASEVSLNGELTYTITVKNESPEGGAALESPVVVDLLPKGARLVSGEGVEAVTVAAGSGVTLEGYESVEVKSANGEESDTAIVIELEGDLAAGAEVTLQITTLVTNAAVSHGNPMTNYAFVTSKKAGTVTADNATGASFKDHNTENWAQKLSDASGSLDANRASALETELGKLGYDHGFLSSSDGANWVSQAGMDLLKEGKGDTDTSYSSTRVSTVSNGGTMDYRLTVSNSSGTDNRTNLVIMDMLPQSGDKILGNNPRYSEWPLKLKEAPSVAGVGVNVAGHYTVYYYTGELKTLDYEIAKQAQTWAKEGAAPGWSTTFSSEAKAFIVVLDNSVRLTAGNSVVVSYSTSVNEYSEAELGELGYTNAVNNFVCHYSSYAANGGNPEHPAAAENLAESDIVTATLIPNPVDVGGHVWIDKNDNGIWEEGESLEDFGEGNTLINDLRDNLSVSLQSYTGSDRTTTPGEFDFDAEDGVHYRFEDLRPAVLDATEEEAYAGGSLDTSKLRNAANATTYQVSIFLNTLGKFKLSDAFVNGDSRGISRNPEAIPASEQIDSNFRESGARGSSLTGTSELFYLWPTSPSVAWDKTKDIGLVPLRDLEITKVAADNQTDKVEGATFKVYGPYDDAEKEWQESDSYQLLVTGNTGIASMNDLLWFKEYVIVEVDPTEVDKADNGYEADSATTIIKADEITAWTDGDGKETGRWILNVPASNATVGEAVKATLTVSNVRETTDSLTITKKLTGGNKTLAANMFSFGLYTDQTCQTLYNNMTASNDGNGSVIFNNILLQGVADHTFYIKEIKGNESGVSYDETVYKAVIKTEWNSTEHKLQTSEGYPKYYEKKEGGWVVMENATPTIHNTYAASTELQIPVTKTVSDISTEESKGDKFTFELYQTSQNYDCTNLTAWDTLELSIQNGTATGTFDALKYSTDTEEAGIQGGAGTYYYVVKEAAKGTGKGTGYTKDTTEYQIEVVITDNGSGTLQKAVTVTKVAENASKTESTITNLSSISFNNKYAASGSKTLTGTKKVDGGLWPAEGTFTFGIYKDKDCTEAADSKNVNQTTNATQTVSAAAEGTFEFTFQYDMDDLKSENGNSYLAKTTKTYYIKEKETNLAGYEEDDTVYKVEVTITDNGNGTLSVVPKVTEKDGKPFTEKDLTFTNTFAATGNASFTGTKRVVSSTADNTEAVLTDSINEFTFDLYSDEDCESKIGRSFTNDAEGTISFAIPSKEGKDFAFDMSDMRDETGYVREKEFSYYVKEATQSYGADGTGYESRGEVYRVTITMELTEEDGKAILKQTGTKVEKQTKQGDGYSYAPSDLTFTNEYQAKGTIKMNARKTVDKGQLGTYEFGIYTGFDEENGVVTGDPIVTVKNNGSGNITYETEITMADLLDHEDGQFIYYIKETTSDGNGLTTDKSIYRMTYTATNQNNGTIAVTGPEIAKWDSTTGNFEEATEAVFKNQYTAKGTFEVTGVKKVEGNNLSAFTFGLFADPECKTKLAEASNKISGEDAGKFTISHEITIDDLALKDSEGNIKGYRESKEFTYYLKEIAEDGNGYDVSDAVYQVKVTMTDNGNGTIVPSSGPTVTLKSGTENETEGTVFTNKYNAEGSYSLSGTKTVENGNLIPGFEFSIYEADQKTLAKNAENATVNSDEDGNFEFNLKFTNEDLKEGSTYQKSREFTYYIREDEPKFPGYEKDSTIYKLVLTVTNDGNEFEPEDPYKEKLDVTRKSLELSTDNGTTWTSADTVSFENTFTASGSDEIIGKKNVEHGNVTEGFEFSIYKNFDTNTGVVSELAEDTVKETTVTNDAKGDFSFKLDFEMEDMLKEGTTDQYLDSKPFTYYIVESALGEGHVNYTKDNTIYKVDFTVTRTEENGEVSLKAGEKTFSVWKEANFVPASGGVSFTNIYRAEGNEEVSGLKSVTNNNLESFEFGIFKDEAENPVTDGTVVERTVHSDAETGEFGFSFHYDMEDLIDGGTYAATKDFTYYIKETSTKAEKPGYEMDGSIYKVTVKVTNNTEVGNLDTEVSIEKKEAGETTYTPYEEKSLNFTNDYQPADATTTLSGHKSVTGGQLKSFKFGIFNADGSPVTDNLANGQTQEVDSDESSGAFQFDLVYDMDDLKNSDGSYEDTRTFTYQIRETSTTGNGYTVGGEVYQAVVTLTNADGKLTAASVITARGSEDPIPSGTPMEFTNSYEAEGDVTIEGTKEITGANMKAFEFGIYADEDCEVPLAVWNNAEKTGVVEQQKVTNDQNGKFGFVLHYTMDALKDDATNTYKTIDSFTYYIKETSVNTTADGSFGYVVDTSVRPVTVTITDLQNGKIQAEITEGEGKVIFTNSYTAEGKETLAGNKTVQNANRTEFTFGIYTDEDCTQKVPEANVNPTATSNAEDGTFSFDFHYTMADLKDGDTYKANDTFIYYVKEDSQKPGYEENTTVYRVKVDVSNEADNGHLTVNPRIDGVKTGEGSFTSAATETLDFENTYTAVEEVSLTGTKNVLGGNQEDGFEFGIFTDEAMETPAEEGFDQENPDARVDENVVTNTNGSFEFKLHFTMDDLKQADGSYAEEGDYTFYIRELTEPAEGSGYAANTMAYKVDYHLTDDTKGNLTAKLTDIQVKDLSDAEATWQDAGSVSFTNQFNAEGSVDISAVKVLTGTALEEGDFTFRLSGDGVDQTKGNGAAESHIATVNGPQDMAQVIFDTIHYTMDDLIQLDADGNEKKDANGNLLYEDEKEFVYVLEEVKPEDANPAYTYSEDKFEIHVTVQNNGSSELQVTTELYRQGEENALVPISEDEELPLVFENQYTAAGSLTLTAEKVLSGSTLAAGQFQFELKDISGNILDTAANEADGSITFDALQYTQADIGQEYTYTVSEVNNEITGVTYDDTIYTVKVQVEDSEESDGTLAITTEVLNGETPVEGEEGTLPAMTFANTFSGSVNLTKQGADGRTLSGAEFTLYAKTAEGDYEPYAAEGNETGVYTTDLSGAIQVTDLPANDYYFVETKAPQGYVIETDANGQPRHYEFTIGVQDGDAGVVEGAVVNAVITVTNDLAQTGTIQVTKRVSRIGDDLSFVDFLAINETFYVGLFYDAEGTQPVGTDNIRRIDMNGVSVSDPVTYSGLTSGTYYVLETNEAGQPIPMRLLQESEESSYYCTVENDGTNQVTLDLTTSEEPGTVALQNVYVEFSEDYYWDATIDITKQVLKDGEEATADDTFYAGVYQMAEDGSYELLTEVELEQNGTVTVTGLGGPIGESMTYYVFETDGNGNRVSEDPAFLYAVSGEGSVTVTQDNTAGSITITNEFEEEEPTEKPTEEPSEKPTEPDTKPTETTSTEPAKTTSTKATKTGDTTDLTVELLLMALAAVLMGTSVYARKRRRSRR